MNRHYFLSEYRKATLILCVILTAVLLLAGCQGGNKGPAEEDARSYVQALLDLTCTGTYDRSVSLSSAGQDKELEIRDSIIDDLYSSTVQGNNLSEAAMNRYHEFLVKAGQKCRYEVTDVVRTGSGNIPEYDVTVSIEPLKAFKNASEILDDEMDALESDRGKLIDMNPDEIYSIAFENVFTELSANLDNPEYAPAENVTVRYHQINVDEDLYGVSENDCRKIGEKLFSLEGLE